MKLYLPANYFFNLKSLIIQGALKVLGHKRNEITYIPGNGFKQNFKLYYINLLFSTWPAYCRSCDVKNKFRALVQVFTRIFRLLQKSVWFTSSTFVYRNFFFVFFNRSSSLLPFGFVYRDLFIPHVFRPLFLSTTVLYRFSCLFMFSLILTIFFPWSFLNTVSPSSSLPSVF